jgi:hypothetical protein
MYVRKRARMSAYRKKLTGMVITSASEMNIMLTNTHVS